MFYAQFNVVLIETYTYFSFPFFVEQQELKAINHQRTKLYDLLYNKRLDQIQH